MKNVQMEAAHFREKLEIMLNTINSGAIWQFTTVELLVQFFYVIQTTILFLFGTALSGKYVKADDRTKEDPSHKLFLLISLAIIGYGLYNIIAILNYFYPGQSWRRVLQQLAISILIFPFGRLADKHSLKERYGISICTIVGVGISIYLTVLTLLEFLNFNIIENNILFMYVPTFTSFTIMGVCGLLVVLKIVFDDLKPQKEVRSLIFKGTLFGFMALGTAIWSGVYLNSLVGGTNILWAVSKLFNVFAWLGFRHYFLKIPSYTQLEWKRGIFRLHIFLLHGISIYSHSFPAQKVFDGFNQNSDNRGLDEISDLIGGGIVGIKGMLGEITGDPGTLESIKIGNKSLVFKSGKYITGLLLCENNYGVYYSLLSDVIGQIEEINPQLKNFNGDVGKLKIEPIFKKVFDMSL